MSELANSLGIRYHLMYHNHWIVGLMPIWLYDGRLYYVNMPFRPGMLIPVDDPE